MSDGPTLQGIAPQYMTTGKWAKLRTRRRQAARGLLTLHSPRGKVKAPTTDKSEKWVMRRKYLGNGKNRGKPWSGFAGCVFKKDGYSQDLVWDGNTQRGDRRTFKNMLLPVWQSPADLYSYIPRPPETSGNIKLDKSCFSCTYIIYHKVQFIN